jgi:hypothetical protein
MFFNRRDASHYAEVFAELRRERKLRFLFLSKGGLCAT